MNQIKDVSYLLQNGNWIPACLHIIDYKFAVKFKNYTWYSKPVKSQEDASLYALRAGYMLARKLGIIK